MHMNSLEFMKIAQAVNHPPQTKEEIEDDAQWCARRIRARDEARPSAGASNSLLDSALDWSLT